MGANQLSDYGWTAEKLSEMVSSGEVIANTGQLSHDNVRALDREVRAGRMAKWRGHWFPTPGAPWGFGPLKTCWGLPEVCDRFTFRLTPDHD